MRIGQGYDVHAFAEGRELYLGGVKIDYELGLLGHSDADVLLHAVCDALLGAAALGDIGEHFPDTDEKYRGIDSKILLKETMKLVRDEGYEVENVDCIVVAQKPHIGRYIPQMNKTIAEILSVNENQVNVKATTEEKLGFTGRLEGIKAYAVCLLK